MADRFTFERVMHNFTKLKKDLPILLANDAQNYFVKPFKTTTGQGFDGKAWTARKKETKKSIGKPILVGTGKLRRAVQNSVREKTFDKVRLVIDGGSIPYASVHNNGSDEMPQRQFMGQSEELKKEQRKTIIKFIDKIWK